MEFFYFWGGGCGGKSVSMYVSGIPINFETGIILVLEITFLSFSYGVVEKGSVALVVVLADVTVGIDRAVILNVGF